MAWRFSIVLLSLTTWCALAGTVPEGGRCSRSRDHTDPSTHKYISQCTDLTFCSSDGFNSTNASVDGDGTCQPRLCRRDEFPFGYGPNDMLPPMCLQGEFCPDEGSGCKGVLLPGADCQFDRDDQCGSNVPSGAVIGSWASERIFQVEESSGYGEVLCLLSICTPANATFDQPCVAENTTYTDFGFDGSLISYSIYRDNCLSPELFCGPSTQRCERKKVLGVECQFDVECESFNCLEGVCVRSLETPYHVAPWQYVVTVLCITGSMTATFVILMLMHKRHRARRYQEVREYYSEQLRLRRAIISLHEAAADALDSRI